MSTYDPPMFSVSTFRRGFDAAGRSVNSVRPASLAGRIAWAIALGLALVAAAIIVIPVLLIGLLLTAAWVLASRVSLFFSSLRRTNGPLDGRRNVRVILPPDER